MIERVTLVKHLTFDLLQQAAEYLWVLMARQGVKLLAADPYSHHIISNIIITDEFFYPICLIDYRPEPKMGNVYQCLRVTTILSTCGKVDRRVKRIDRYSEPHMFGSHGYKYSHNTLSL